MNTLVMSLVGFRSTDEISAYQAEFPDMRYELSYKMSSPLLEAVLPLLSGKIESVHACCPSLPIFPNLGSYDPEVLKASHEALEETFKTAKRAGASIVVLHPGYVCDALIPSANADRKRLLDGPDFKRFVAVEDGAICDKRYPNESLYRHHAHKAIEQLSIAAKRADSYGLKLAAENLNPRVGYLFQTPEEMTALSHIENLFLCLDVGHLWISSFVYDFPYLESVNKILGTGRVVNCHIHSNSTNGKALRFRDDHHTIDKYGFPLSEVLELLSASSDANLVLETIEESEYNTRCLVQRLERRSDRS